MNSFEKIYEIVAKIPKGKISTYKKVAEMAGLNPKASGARVVGFALNKNKNSNQIPCHRVINVKGELTGYAFGGVKKKRELLEKEGVEFLQNGTIDLQKYLFNP